MSTNILAKIVAQKFVEVAERKKQISIGELEAMPLFSKAGYSLKSNLVDPNKTGIIAEFKRQSPSKGIINNTALVHDVTKAYSDFGASGISVLTDTHFFGGSLDDLEIAVKNTTRNSTSLFEKTLQEYGVNRNSLEIQLEFADYLTFVNNTPQKAIRVLEKALSFSSSKFKKARIKLKLGEVLVFVGKFNEALIYFSQVQTKLKNHPLSQEARFKVAQTSYFKGDFKWAKSQFRS